MNDLFTDTLLHIHSPMLSCTFVSSNSRHSFSMRLPERVCRRCSASNDGSTRDSHELPKFSFEGDDRPLVSTERLFNQWSEDEETANNLSFSTIARALRTEQDIIVSECFHARMRNTDAYRRSLGMDRMIPQTRSTGRSRGNGSSQCLVSMAH